MWSPGSLNDDSACPLSSSSLASLQNTYTNSTSSQARHFCRVAEPHRIVRGTRALPAVSTLSGAYKPPSTLLFDDPVLHHSRQLPASSNCSCLLPPLLLHIPARLVPSYSMSLKGVMQNVLTNGLASVVRNATMPQQHVAVLG